MSDKELIIAIDKTLKILEETFRTRNTSISEDEIFNMVNDIYVMFKNVESKVKECGEFSIKRYIPILNLLVITDKNKEHAIAYNKYLKYAYKLGARISLEHYMIYREWEVDEKEKFYEPRASILSGYIHYLQEIETNPKFTTLIFNAPSGYGKSYPEKISEAWSFGIDSSGTILSLCSNDSVVKGGSHLVIDEIKSDCYGEVFPSKKYSIDDKNYFLKETDGEWKLRDCKLLASYYASTINSNVIGERASKRIHIDDLYPDYKEAQNQTLNEFYYNKYLTSWKTRFVQHKKPKVVITGTLWASGDFIDRIIESTKKTEKFYPSKKYKYVWLNLDESIAIIQVPALDYVTETSTCPELKSTNELLQEKKSIDPYLWQTNFQQIPTNPEGLSFSYEKLRTYATIPETDYIGAYAVIDANRKSGRDYFAMPIFKKVKSDNKYDYYLKDCIFTKTATKDMYEDVADKISENHIIKVVIESNVTSELSNAINERLKNRGISYCEIIEKYNTIPKETRIENEKSIIARQLVFPERNMYGYGTDIGKYMENLTTYNATGTNENDDAPDSSAMFASEIIEENSIIQNAEVLTEIRNYI